MKKSILVALSITLFSLVSMAQEINPVLITIDGKEIRKNESEIELALFKDLKFKK